MKLEIETRILSQWTQLHCLDTKWYHSIFHETTLKAIQKTLQKWKKIITYVNKKGMYGWTQCESCGNIPQCKHCDIPIAIHENNHKELFGLCSICQELYSYPESCGECWSVLVDGFGVGIQQVSDYCRSFFQQTNITTIQWWQTALSKTADQLQAIDSAQIMIATSFFQAPILQNLWLIVIQTAGNPRSADYNANKDEFRFLSDCLRYWADHIIMQTRDTKSTIIRALMEWGEQEFLEKDSVFRMKHNYPPYGELCIFMYRNEVESAMYSKVHKLFQDIMQLKLLRQYEDIEVYAIPAHVYKAYNKFRFQIIIKWEIIRPFVDEIMIRCKPLQKWFKVDRNARGFM